MCWILKITTSFARTTCLAFGYFDGCAQQQQQTNVIQRRLNVGDIETDRRFVAAFILHPNGIDASNEWKFLHSTKKSVKHITTCLLFGRQMRISTLSECKLNCKPNNGWTFVIICWFSWWKLYRSVSLVVGLTTASGIRVSITVKSFYSFSNQNFNLHQLRWPSLRHNNEWQNIFLITANCQLGFQHE